MKIAFALLCYLTAFVSIYAATTIDPVLSFDTPWTDHQWLAAHLLVIGMSTKLLGHALLIKVANQ